MKYEVKDLNAPSRWNMRIWDDDKKEWFCQSDKERLTYYGFDITGGETTEFQGLPKWYPDRHLIWEQSTGLKDKNGKEIYEGDVIKVFSTDEYVMGFEGIYRVYFDNHWLSYQMYKIKSSYSSTAEPFEPEMSTNIEVIGNIHENPDLLEKGGEE